MFRNLEEQVLYLTKTVEQIQQVLGNALPDPIPGPQGDPGEQGVQGEPGPQGFGIVGYGTQLPASGRDGDWFILKTSTMTGIDYVMYRCVLQHWVAQFSIRGPAGPIANATEVVANPALAASDSLNKIKIDGVIYSIPEIAPNPTYSDLNPGLTNITINGTTYNIMSAEQKDYLDTLYNSGSPLIEFNSSNVSIPNNFTVDGNFSCGGNASFRDDISVEGNAFFDNGLQVNGDTLDEITDSNGDPLIICERLWDANGNPRFIEGDITPVSMTGVTYSYTKWSLSGTHLMIVACGTIASGNKFVGGGDLFKVMLPSWILSKIQPTLNALISYGSLLAVDSSYYTTQVSIYFDKKTDHILCGVSSESGVFENDNNFRIVFDLLIDMA